MSTFGSIRPEQPYMAAASLTIIQINFHHSNSAFTILQKCIAMMHTGISLIQEPWINKDAIGRLGGGGQYDLRSETSLLYYFCEIDGKSLVYIWD